MISILFVRESFIIHDFEQFLFTNKATYLVLTCLAVLVKIKNVLRERERC